MFCTKCGSELPDGVKFCTSCGAQLNFVSAPAFTAPAQPETPAPAAAPEAPQTSGWQQPQAPQASGWQQPQAPQTNGWQQPQTPPQANGWQQPQTPQANGWQQPQTPPQQQWQQPQTPPPQWQQIQQQWDQQQQQRQQWQSRQAPQANGWQQPQTPPQQQWQQPPVRGGGHAAPKKKSAAGLIIGIIAAVLVIAVGVGGFVWPGFFRKNKDGAGTGGGNNAVSVAIADKFSTPEEFFQTVETNNADVLAGHVSSTYDNVFLSNASSDDICAEGSLSIEPGDKVRELVKDALGEQLDQINPGDDLKWLKNLTLDYDISKKDEMSMVNLGLQLNGSSLLHLKLVVDLDAGDVWLSVPELSDKYMQTTLEDLDLDDIGISGLDLRSMISGLTSSVMSGAIAGVNPDAAIGELSPEDAEKLDPVTKALPDADTANKLLTKYLNEAIDSIEDVEKETDTLTVEGVSAEYTVLTSTITPEALVKIVEKIGPELKEDDEIRKIILDVAGAAGEDGEAKYREFTDKIDELLNDHSKITEGMTDDLVLIVYLDKSGDVHGRVIDAGSQKLELLMPESGGKFGFRVRFVKDGEEQLLVKGEGKRSGDKLTGDLELNVNGEYYADLHLDGFDIEKAKDGFFVGGIEIKPTASFWTMVREKMADGEGGSKLPEALNGILDTLVFNFDLNTAKDKAAVTLTVTNGKDKLITIGIDGTKSAAKKISTVDGVETSVWTQDITLDKLEKVIAAIEKAGVPTAYTDMLDQALENAF